MIETDTLYPALFWVLGQDVVNVPALSTYCNVDEKLAASMIIAMEQAGIIRNNGNGLYPVLINSIDLIPDNILEKLKMRGYTNEDIITQLNPDDSKKEEVSILLQDEYWKWHNVDDAMPDEGKEVFIRLRNNTETVKAKTMKSYVEDGKMATYENGEWKLMPPFPKYDFSPLTSRGIIKPDTFVTHWAYANEENIHDWSHRFDFINDYQKLVLEVDEYNEESVYDALVLAGAAISSTLERTKPNDPLYSKLENAHIIMCDLQSAIDKNQ